MARDIRNGYEVVKKWEDWALLDRGEYGYVVAHYPNYDDAGNITDWAHGHYYTDFFDAVHYVESEIKEKTVLSLTSQQKQALTSCLTTDIEQCCEYIEEANEPSYFAVCDTARQLIYVLEDLGVDETKVDSLNDMLFKACDTKGFNPMDEVSFDESEEPDI